MSDLGLVELTRKRIRESVVSQLTSECRHCHGAGYVKSLETIGREILRAAEKSLAGQGEKELRIEMHPSVADYLYDSLGGPMDALEKSFGASLVPVTRDSYHREEYRIL